jgi:O-acetyl-ADP-ribose deacetylase (regulator of RNase III)
VAELRAVQADITTLEVDAIVNAANSSLLGGGGVDGAIHHAAGPELLAECRAIRDRQGGCRPGEAVITGAGRLPARHVIHTVGPVWSGDDPDGDAQTLGSCYRRSLDLASDHGLATIAFPAVSTGIYGFPKERACEVAVSAVRSWLAEHPSVPIATVIFVCFSPGDLDRYARRLT